MYVRQRVSSQSVEESKKKAMEGYFEEQFSSEHIDWQ